MKTCLSNIFTAIFIFLSAICFGQKKVPPVALQPFYKNDFDIIIDKFEREHLPLDGAEVKYIPSRKDEFFGFVDKKTREWIIKPEFTQVFAVYPEGAIVEKDGNYGLVDYRGSFIIPPYFKNLYKEGNIYHGLFTSHDTSMNQSFAAFTYNCYYTEAGKALFAMPAHAQGGRFSAKDSMVWFRYVDTFYVVGQSGKLVKRIPYNDKKFFMGTFNNCLVFREDGEKFIGFAWYEPGGKLRYQLRAFSKEVQMVYHLSDTMYARVSEEGIDFVNDKGKRYPFAASGSMIFPGFTQMYDRWLNDNELLQVQDMRTGLQGFVSGKGALAIPCKYKAVGPFVNGEAPFLDTVSHKVGFINTSGTEVIPPTLSMENMERRDFADEPLGYSDGLCLVATGHRMHMSEDDVDAPYYGYAGRDGKIALALPDSIIFAGSFSDGLAAVVSKSKGLGFINKKGEVVIPFKYELAVQGGYPFPQIVIPRFINGFAYLKAFKGYIDAAGNEYFSGKRIEDHYNFSH